MPRIIGRNVMLREYMHEDIRFIDRWVNDKATTRMLDPNVFTFPRPLEKTAEFVAEKAADNVISEGTLQRFTARQEERVSLPSETDYKAEHCMLTACEDQALEGSGRFGHVLVKRLPEEDIVSVLSPYNGYLHTAGVLEGGTKIQELLIHAGVTRITRLGDMSRYFDGEAHDGVFPLELYTKIVDIQR